MLFWGGRKKERKWGGKNLHYAACLSVRALYNWECSSVLSNNHIQTRVKGKH